MKILTPFIVLAVVTISSCGEKKKSQQDLLYDEVIAIHDEIMPKMGDIMKYKKLLTQRVNTLIDEGMEENAVTIEAVKKAVADLEVSHEEMMDWMHQFNPEFKDMTEKEIMDYLNDQKTKIEQVGKTTSEALTNAEKLLNK